MYIYIHIYTYIYIYIYIQIYRYIRRQEDSDIYQWVNPICVAMFQAIAACGSLYELNALFIYIYVHAYVYIYIYT